MKSLIAQNLHFLEMFINLQVLPETTIRGFNLEAQSGLLYVFASIIYKS